MSQSTATDRMELFCGIWHAFSLSDQPAGLSCDAFYAHWFQPVAQHCSFLLCYFVGTGVGEYYVIESSVWERNIFHIGLRAKPYRCPTLPLLTYSALLYSTWELVLLATNCSRHYNLNLSTGRLPALWFCILKAISISSQSMQWLTEGTRIACPMRMSNTHTYITLKYHPKQLHCILITHKVLLCIVIYCINTMKQISHSGNKKILYTNDCS